MNAVKILLAATIIAAMTLCSGCIFCCGLDSQLSKYKKSVTEITLPDSPSIGGKQYHLGETDTQLSRAEVKAGIIDVLGELAYPRSDIETATDQAIDTAGIYEYKYFNYTGSSKAETFGVYVAKAGSPFTVMTGFESLRQLLDSSLWFINNPSYNWGGVNNITYAGSSTVGDGSEKYRADVFGQGSYTVVARYSNLYVLAYSFESFEVAEEAARMAIKEIDTVTAGP
ncbi:hypothetical protein [Methanocella arvoryzae]|uniref:hypothetical protein n=1 Tax=Methanocella arvoryzae TaxID=1175445 RepID=UPI000321FB2C|nr:hypothetical protein [Methanocella arvoryzae]